MLSITDLRQDQGMTWYDDVTQLVHDEALFIIVSYGKCIYWIDESKVIVEKGDLLFLPPGSAYYGKSIPTVMHEKMVFRLKLHSGSDAGLAAVQAPRWIKSKTGSYELYLERLRIAWKEWTEGLPYAELRANAIVLEVLVLWSRELEAGVKLQSGTQEHVERMKQYIQNRYRERVTKEELGAHSGRSPNYAASLFRQVTGQTISEYVHAVRMRTAVYMLTESLLTVGEIAEYLGYADVSYFQRIFKRTYGRTPSYYLAERQMV
ncbi:AraC family transcriptional regulator [Paenibacillus sp. GCM10023252]|uniref:helix-turn-helix domain-containing protein n=1 Tax=Paenibacillus sp. GCM10023252 TaxID=3252649 RepID=UPI00361AF4EE